MKLQQTVVSQFRCPGGSLGHLAGFIMARRPSNLERNQWTLDLLELKREDRVLEIGFGPGIALERASHIVTSGLLVGVDHSETMLRQAARRNQAALAEGRMQLHLAGADRLPAFDRPFDKIFSANVVQFWPDPAQVFRSLRAHLSPGGTLATTYMPRHRGATAADTRRTAEKVVRHLEEAGFSRILVKERPMKPVPVACVLAVQADD